MWITRIYTLLKNCNSCIPLVLNYFGKDMIKHKRLGRTVAMNLQASCKGRTWVCMSIEDSGKQCWRICAYFSGKARSKGYTGVGTVADLSNELLSSSVDPRSGQHWNSRRVNKYFKFWRGEQYPTWIPYMAWGHWQKEQEFEQVRTTVTDLTWEVEQLKAEWTRVNQQATTTWHTAPDSPGSVVRMTPVEMVQRSHCSPMFYGNGDEKMGGKWISRVEFGME